MKAASAGKPASPSTRRCAYRWRRLALGATGGAETRRSLPPGHRKRLYDWMHFGINPTGWPYALWGFSMPEAASNEW
jgi:hypothetical protein